MLQLRFIDGGGDKTGEKNTDGAVWLLTGTLGMPFLNPRVKVVTAEKPENKTYTPTQSKGQKQQHQELSVGSDAYGRRGNKLAKP